MDQVEKTDFDQLVGNNHEHTLNCVRFLTNERISSQSLLERYIASASLSQETQAFGRAFLKCHEGSVALWAICYICECSVITLDKDFNGNTMGISGSSNGGTATYKSIFCDILWGYSLT